MNVRLLSLLFSFIISLFINAEDKLLALDEVSPSKSYDVSRSSEPSQPVEKKSEKRPDRLKFLNGDSISGQFRGITDGYLLWRHPSFSEPVQVVAKDVSSIQLETAQSIGSGPEDCEVSLVSGGRLNGKLTGLSETVLTLDTWYGGELKISRKFVRSIEPGIKPERVIYEGPQDGPDGWMTGNRNTGQALKLMAGKNKNNAEVGGDKQRALAVLGLVRGVGRVKVGAAANQGAWRYANNAFICASSGPILGRKDLDLPERCALHFDLQWTGYFNLGVNIFADQINNEYSGNSYSLRIDQNNVYLYRIQNGSTSNLGNTPSQLSGKKKCKITMFVNKEAKQIAVAVNGRLIRKWDDSRPFAGKGKGLLFTSRNNSAMRLGGIRITEWNGSLPESDSAKLGNGKEDFVIFSNKDSISGKAKRIDGDKLIFTTNFGDVPLPVSNMRTLIFNNQAKSPTPKDEEVQILMVKGGRLNAELLAWGDKTVKVKSPVFGEAVLNQAVFEKLDFNLNQPRKEDDGGLFGP